MPVLKPYRSRISDRRTPNLNCNINTYLTMISCTDHAGFDWFIFVIVCFFIQCYSLHHAHLKVLLWSENIYDKTRDHKWSPHVMIHFFVSDENNLNTFTLTRISQADVTWVPLSVKHIHRSGVTIQLKTIAHPRIQMKTAPFWNDSYIPLFIISHAAFHY